MNTVAKVNLWENMVGAVAWNDDSGFATFQFEPDFLKKGLAIAPITMPIDKATNGNGIFSFRELNNETYKGLPGLLADSLPDRFGNILIESWLAQQGRDPASFNSVERLCYTGKRGMGALEYEPVIPSLTDKSGPIEINELVKLTKEVLNERINLKLNIHDKKNEGLLTILRVGTSAGGNRAKAIIAYNENTGDVRSGQIDDLEGYSYWIIKFDGVNDKQLGDPKGYCKIEYAYYLMAKDCGITMTECKLLEEHKRAHFMTRRFDRNGMKKLHTQTLCAIAHFDYNSAGAYSYEQAFQIMRQLKLPYGDLEELYRRMVFNVIARNQDDHTKNISFLMDETGKWSLSPAYDLTYAYDPANIWMKSHQMSVNGKRDDITNADLTQVAKRMNIKKSKEIVDSVLDIVSNWKKYAKKANVDLEQTKKINKVLRLKL
jgi:serine/threonine-protein kinase HipA